MRGLLVWSGRGGELNALLKVFEQLSTCFGMVGCEWSISDDRWLIAFWTVSGSEVSLCSCSDVWDDACFVGDAEASGSKSDLRTNESRVVRPGILSSCDVGKDSIATPNFSAFHRAGTKQTSAKVMVSPQQYRPAVLLTTISKASRPLSVKNLAHSKRSAPEDSARFMGVSLVGG
ncbi:hypothetical protein KCV03_g96, partial [Aureobasidium melanogenum]